MPVKNPMTEEERKAKSAKSYKWQRNSNTKNAPYVKREDIGKCIHSLRWDSNCWLRLVLPFRPDGYEIHHAFGWVKDRFIFLPKKLHTGKGGLHSKFGDENEDCLWSNPKVRKFLKDSGQPFYIIDGTEVTMYNLEGRKNGIKYNVSFVRELPDLF